MRIWSNNSRVISIQGNRNISNRHSRNGNTTLHSASTSSSFTSRPKTASCASPPRPTSTSTATTVAAIIRIR
ncbi:unnamed protein product [Closterium sp. NIES-54]